jgi:hypothetical protein
MPAHAELRHQPFRRSMFWSAAASFQQRVLARVVAGNRQLEQDWRKICGQPPRVHRGPKVRAIRREALLRAAGRRSPDPSPARAGQAADDDGYLRRPVAPARAGPEIGVDGGRPRRRGESDRNSDSAGLTCVAHDRRRRQLRDDPPAPFATAPRRGDRPGIGALLRRPDGGSAGMASRSVPSPSPMAPSPIPRQDRVGDRATRTRPSSVRAPRRADPRDPAASPQRFGQSLMNDPPGRRARLRVGQMLTMVWPAGPVQAAVAGAGAGATSGARTPRSAPRRGGAAQLGCVSASRSPVRRTATRRSAAPFSIVRWPGRVASASAGNCETRAATPAAEPARS